MSDSRFKIVGALAVVDSATVICLRQRKGADQEVLHRSRFRGGGGGAQLPAVTLADPLFGNADSMTFSSGWEVLLGQGECVNWLRSTGPDRKSIQLMRYGGEFKLAGGNVDSGESFLDAARRELEEEFLRPASISLPASASIRPLVLKQTMPVRSKSNLMWNFVALESENDWLASLDVDAVNAHLADRRRRFDKSVASGEFWALPPAEKELLAPEVREMRWVPLGEAVWMALSTMVAAGAANFVNDFQRREFARLGVKQRDPMFMTGVTLMEIEAFSSEADLAAYCDGLADGGGMAAEQARLQWLFPGMTHEDLRAGGRQGKGEPKEMVKDFPAIMQLRAQRLRRVGIDSATSRL